MEIKKSSSGIDPVVLLRDIYRKNFAEGLVATDGVVRSAVVTFGTADTQIFDELVNPGVAWKLDQIEVSFTQRFDEVANKQGSINYYWQVRSEAPFLGTTGKPVATITAWIPISGTYQKGIGSLANSEDTFSGYIPVGSVPRAPLRVNLTANALLNAQYTGRIKNSSFIEITGMVIPGA